jgi:hypothetical protein
MVFRDAMVLFENDLTPRAVTVDVVGFEGEFEPPTLWR